MEDLRSIARLPGSEDSQPLLRRNKPYLRLPSAIQGDAALRDAAYRLLLPEGATYASRFLRRYTFEALVKRAKAEEKILRNQSQFGKALTWMRHIEVAETDYAEEVRSRRYMSFRSQDKMRGCSSKAPSPHGHSAGATSAIAAFTTTGGRDALPPNAGPPVAQSVVVAPWPAEVLEPIAGAAKKQRRDRVLPSRPSGPRLAPGDAGAFDAESCDLALALSISMDQAMLDKDCVIDLTEEKDA